MPPLRPPDKVPECEKSSATTYYWYRQALDISDSISDSGGLNWKMTLALLAAWTLVCLAMIKGIQSSGKVRQPSDVLPDVRHSVRRVVCTTRGKGASEDMKREREKKQTKTEAYLLQPVV